MATTGSIESRRIVLIDDDTDCRELLAQILQHGGLEVEGFENVEDAFVAITESPPSVVVMDIAFGSRMNGYEAARKIRALPCLAGVCLIAVTGYSSEIVQQEGQLFDAIFTKPMDCNALIRVVTELGAGAEPQARTQGITRAGVRRWDSEETDRDAARAAMEELRTGPERTPVEKTT